MPRGTIRATVLIETILAAFEMDEILYELREHSAGLNAGRWDYIFSVIKKLGHRPEFVLPDRGDVTMAVPFMRSYCELLVKTCHAPRRVRDGRHGGVHPVAARRRGERGRAREGARGQGARGGARASTAPGSRIPTSCPSRWRSSTACSASGRTRSTGSATTSHVDAADLLDVAATPGEITEQGLRNNVSVGIQYLAAWLERQRRRGDQQPDGGCRHGRDLALADLAVAPPRPGDGRRRAPADRRGGGARSARTTPRRASSSSRSRPQPEYVEFLTLPAYERLA